MRDWSVLGSVLLMRSGVFGWSLLMARWIDSKTFYVIIPSTLNSERQTYQGCRVAQSKAG